MKRYWIRFHSTGWLTTEASLLEPLVIWGVANQVNNSNSNNQNYCAPNLTSKALSAHVNMTDIL